MKRTAIVILNWNTKEYLRKFLPGLLATTGEEDEVIVADNASTDGSVEMMKAEFPNVGLICLDKNYGFTGGYNRALAQIKAKYFLLINSDIEVSKGWLTPLVKMMEDNPDVGACGPKLLSYYNRDYFEYAGAAGGLIDSFGYPFCRGRIMKKVEKDNGQYNRPTDVFWVTGACLMTRSSLYKQLGGLDERFFAHMEEIDLCWRMQLEGYKIRTVPQSHVYHIGGGTLDNTSPRKLFFNFRNNLLMLQKNLAATYFSQMQTDKKLDTATKIKFPAKIEAKTHLEAMSNLEAKAKKKAKRTIFLRMCLDGMSAIAYLLMGKFSYFKAVIDAHSDYRKMVKVVKTESLTQNSNISDIKGIFKGWIIFKGIFCKNITAKDLEI